MSLSRDELTRRLAQHEDSFVERKLEGDDWKPTLVAFANSVPHGRDAVLYIGVRDDGEIAGVSNADSIQKKLQAFCRNTCYPPMSFTTELLTAGDAQVIAVVVPPSSNRPHFAAPAYVREGTKTVSAAPRLFEDLIASRTSKTAELLRYRGIRFTIMSAKTRLGIPEYLATRAGTSMTGQIREYECALVEVNAFFARFELSGANFTEPLENLTISYDDRKHRPLVTIHLDGAG